MRASLSLGEMGTQRCKPCGWRNRRFSHWRASAVEANDSGTGAATQFSANSMTPFFKVPDLCVPRTRAVVVAVVRAVLHQR
jgi:hypothetical protein